MAATRNRSVRILVVEDDPSILDAVSFSLEKRGYTVQKAADGLSGLKLLRREHPDLMLLDLMLPGMDGWKLCEQIRQEGFDLPIIILSARTSEFDKVQGLSMGADDYVTKPFSMDELAARIEANLRRTRDFKPVDTEVVQIGEIAIDPGLKQAFGRGEPLDLTPREFAVLHLLARKSPSVISREDLYSTVWGYEMFHGDRSVDVYINRIRKKLARKLPGVECLHTHYGFGYNLEIKEQGQGRA
jgi:DNA-binding response OmpR family regulator